MLGYVETSALLTRITWLLGCTKMTPDRLLRRIRTGKNGMKIRSLTFLVGQIDGADGSEVRASALGFLNYCIDVN